MLLALFGYMDVLIILKWVTDFTGRESEAPSVISTMINMFLAGGAVPDGEAALIGSPSTQASVSTVIVFVVLICVPIMLVPKPILLSRAFRKEQERKEKA